MIKALLGCLVLFFLLVCFYILRAVCRSAARGAEKLNAQLKRNVAQKAAEVDHYEKIINEINTLAIRISNNILRKLNKGLDNLSTSQTMPSWAISQDENKNRMFIGILIEYFKSKGVVDYNLFDNIAYSSNFSEYVLFMARVFEEEVSGDVSLQGKLVTTAIETVIQKRHVDIYELTSYNPEYLLALTAEAITE